MTNLNSTLKRLSIITDKEIEERKNSRVRGGLTRLNNSLNKINEFIIGINSINSKVTLEVISNTIKLDKENIRRRLTEEQKEIIKNHNKLIKYKNVFSIVLDCVVPINSLEPTPERQNIGFFPKMEESGEMVQNLDIKITNKPSETQLDELSQEITPEPILDIQPEVKIDLNAANRVLTEEQENIVKRYLGQTKTYLEEDLIGIITAKNFDEEELKDLIEEAKEYEKNKPAPKKQEERKIASIESYRKRPDLSDFENDDDEESDD